MLCDCELMKVLAVCVHKTREYNQVNAGWKKNQQLSINLITHFKLWNPTIFI